MKNGGSAPPEKARWKQRRSRTYQKTKQALARLHTAIRQIGLYFLLKLTPHRVIQFSASGDQSRCHQGSKSAFAD
jgi:hypothetical protein